MQIQTGTELISCQEEMLTVHLHLFRLHPNISNLGGQKRQTLCFWFQFRTLTLYMWCVEDTENSEILTWKL